MPSSLLHTPDDCVYYLKIPTGNNVQYTTPPQVLRQQLCYAGATAHALSGTCHCGQSKIAQSMNAKLHFRNVYVSNPEIQCATHS
jgi:hypothetical protein